MWINNEKEVPIVAKGAAISLVENAFLIKKTM